MRSKADAIDYKYFVEPNIPKYRITNEWLDQIKKSIPELPRERKNKYLNKIGLSSYETNIIIKEKEYSDYYEEWLRLNLNPKIAANWLTVEILGYLNKNFISLNDFYLKPKYLKEILDAMDKGIISSKQAKEIFYKSIEEEKEPKNYINKDNVQLSDEEELTEIITNILKNNQNQVNEYKNGRSNLFDYFVGQVMKETKGKANPVITKEILNKKLN